MEAESLVLVGEPEVAVSGIEDAMTLPAVFREQLGRFWGHVLVEAGCERLACRWREQSSPFALPDALAFAFASRANGGPARRV